MVSNRKKAYYAAHPTAFDCCAHLRLYLQNESDWFEALSQKILDWTSAAMMEHRAVWENASFGTKEPKLLPRVLIGIGEILPRVDVRAAYSMYYYRRFLLWALVVGLVLKFAYVVYFTQRSWSRCVAMDVAINAASSTLNLIGVPVAWLAWALPRLALNRIFGTDGSDPVNWIAMLLIIAMVATLSEASVLYFAFKQRLGRKAFWFLYVANAVCVGAAACENGFYAAAHPPIA